MAKIRQSACVGCFTREGVTAETVIREAKRIGYAAVESVGEEHWGLARELALPVTMLCGHWPLDKGCVHVEDRAEIDPSIRGSIDKAAENGIPNVLLFSGNRRGISDEQGAANAVEYLKSLAGLAEKKKVTLSLELLNGIVDHPDYMCDHTAWGLDVVKRVGSPRVKLLYDIYHMQITEGNLIPSITGAIDYISHFHTAGNPGRNDLDDTQEIHYPGVMRAIAGTSYAGFVGHEFFPKGDPIAALEAAFRICNVG